MPNRLSASTSPYLLQHAENPVDWYPWGEEALEKARREDRPIFLSIGYSACHWCHVMEHESFEDEAIARVLNEHFVSIKVDREERPDLDQIYMNVVQMISGHGGWPMSVFLTPEAKPIFAGTYWPPEPRMGMPGFGNVLEAVIELWRTRRDKATEQAEMLTARLQELERRMSAGGGGPVAAELLAEAEEHLRRIFDFTHGGFGSRPKFPHAAALSFLLRRHRRTGGEGPLRMVLLNLRKMARGGIFDHLGGGFARYAVDEAWRVPHFEKMLYDNALLAGAYLDAYLVTRDEELAATARQTLDYVLREMTDAGGGFHSSEDADSEGEEGKFYLWTVDELVAVLGPESAERFAYVYDVSDVGNFEGKNILHLSKTFDEAARLKGWDAAALREEMAACRAKLFVARSRRIRPGKDDKVLVNWNALMIDALARAGAILGDPRYPAAARRAADFLLAHLRREDGRLLHTWRAGRAHLDAYLDDYAFLAGALVTLYEETFEERWIDEAVRLADVMLARFRDPQGGGFFYTADDHEPLLVRSKDFYESSIPSGNAMAATVLLRLGRLCGRADYLTAARETLEAAADVARHSAPAAGQLLAAMDMLLGPLPEIVVVGDPQAPPVAEALADLRRRYLPNRVLACRPRPDLDDGSGELDPIFLGRTAAEPPPAVYVCEGFVCREPVRGREAAIALWRRLEAEAQTG